MKLIDLLVQELPKRGGWPDFVDSIHQDHDGEIYAWTGSSCKLLFRTGIIADNCRPCGLDESIENMVTRNQYKSAIALLQKPAWNGEGLPPVGCECECHVDEGVIHCIVVGYDFDGKAVVMRNVPARKYFSIQANSGRIKPLRTEAERKRDAAAEAIDWYMPEFIPDTLNDYYHAKKIYDAIAAGKIPGVKLDD